MFNALAKVTTTIDNIDEVKKLLKDLEKKEVFVGIPEGSASDRSMAAGNVEGNSDITNAELLYIHTHGVRAQPMRDEMNPAVHSGEMTYSHAYSLWIMAHGSPLWQSPPRPVLEPAIEHNKEKVAGRMKKVAQAALNGEDPKQALEKVGILGQNLARGWFTDPNNDWPPNAPSTVEAKGSDKPMIDSGELRKTITYVIREGE